MESVLHVPAFEDNYIWLAQGAAGRVVIVDPGEAHPVIEVLDRRGLVPEAILCTHHHGDHVGGIDELVDRFGLPVYGPASESIPCRQHALQGGEQIQMDVANLTFEVLSVPGHTRGHIAFFGHGWLFCGDTLFSAGCGRLFEGTPEQMLTSLQRLAALPESTEVYCAHEYTEANLRFALVVEPDNARARQHQEAVRDRRGRGLPSLPSTIALEKSINPFLRVDLPPVRQSAENHAGRKLETALEVFTVIRRWKDTFRG